MSDRKAVRVRITGRVQGVWFRAWTVETARGLGLTGWVRNRRDGSVEALFCGPDQALQQMLAACKIGPPAARVTDLQTESVPPTNDASFEFRETG